MTAKIFTLIATILFLLFTPALAFAQTPNTASVSALPATVSPTSPLFTDLLLSNIFHSISCIAVGQSVIGQPCLTYQVTKNAQGALQTAPVLAQANFSSGILGTTTSLLGALYTNRPVSTAEYLGSVGEDLGIVKQAHAQVLGSGQAVLSPVLALWQVSRNVAYMIMIIIFVVIGVMVMFRNRINPQTVITAQAALPGLVIGLILITFSYFIAGVISDTAFVGTNIVGYYFQAVQGKPPQNLVQDLSNQSVLKVFTPFTKVIDRLGIQNALKSVWNDLGDPNVGAVADIANWTPQSIITILATFMVFQLLSPLGGLIPGVGNALAAGGAIALGWSSPLFMASVALSFIGMLALMYAMLRLLLRLINVFIHIIFSTITAPFTFLFASLPGRQGMATDWIMTMLGNVLVFPAVIAVFYFVATLLGLQYISAHCAAPCPFQVSQLNNANSGFTAQATDGLTITGNANFPLFGGMDLGFVKLLIAFGALVAIPAIPDIVIRSVGKVSQAGDLIGREIGSGISSGQRYSNQIQSGTSGALGQVGSLREQAGYVPGGKPGEWLKVTSRTPGMTAEKAYQAGLRPGTWSKIKTGWRGFWR